VIFTLKITIYKNNWYISLIPVHCLQRNNNKHIYGFNVADSLLTKLKTLNIKALHANTPQAKGRVERANKTLQDRLVKELRLQNISTIEEANQYLPTFMKQHNQKFGVEPRSPIDAHRKVLHNEAEVKQILSIHYQRKLSKNLAWQQNNVEYQIMTKTKGYRLRQSHVTLCEEFNGTITILQKGKVLKHRTLNKGEAPIPIVDEKTLQYTIEQAKLKQANTRAFKPKVDHPWKRSYKNNERPAAKGDILALG